MSYFILAHDQARQRAQQAIKDAPQGHAVWIEEATRSNPQNAKLHAIFGDVAKQEMYVGRHLNSVQWKTLFISGHAIATGLGVDMIPGLENEFVNIRESSAKMSVARMSSLIEYTVAWCADRGTRLSA
jgi:hypothetical protein